MPGAGRRARATCLFNVVQMAISQLLAARGAARRRRRRQSLDLGLGRVGRGPTPPEGRSLRGHPGAPLGRATRPRRVACEIHNNCCNLLYDLRQTAITVGPPCAPTHSQAHHAPQGCSHAWQSDVISCSACPQARERTGGRPCHVAALVPHCLRCLLVSLRCTTFDAAELQRLGDD